MRIPVSGTQGRGARCGRARAVLSRPAVPLIACLILVAPAWAQRRSQQAARITPENLVPEEVFPAADARRFGYTGGLEISYSASGELSPVEQLAWQGDAYHWKLVEPPPAASPTPSPTPSPSPTPADPSAPAVEAPPAPPEAQATVPPEVPPPSPGEEQFLRNAGLLRPTFVTLLFTESPRAASELVEQAFKDRSDEAARPANLAVLALDKDSSVAPGGFVYQREFNLGAKSGGVRRAAAFYFTKGPAVVIVDARLGLRDEVYEADFNRLQDRARSVARYLLRKL